MYFRYFLYWPFNLAIVLLAYLLSPFLSALSLVVGPKLPIFLQWFSTTDADLDGGIDQGVEGYEKVSGFKLWWQRTCWICRNPAHGWQAEVLGMSTEGLIFLSTTDEEQKWYLMENNKGQRFFMLKKDQPLFGNFYLKLWFGWLDKARDHRNHQYEFQIGLKRKKA